MELKIELMKLGKRQKDLIPELREKGYKVNPGDMSAYLSGYIVTPKSQEVLKECENIIERWKADEKQTDRSE